MHEKGKSIWNGIKITLIVLAIFNLILGLYYRPSGWIDRSYGATTAIWNPGTTYIQGMEGYGIYKVDKRGYLNPEFEMAEIEYLTVGASHSQGKEVLYGNRYTDLLNAKNGANKYYTVSQDGMFFPQIVTGFSAIVSEFPNVKGIIIEIGGTWFEGEVLQKSLKQRDFKEEECGENLWKGLSLNSKLKAKVKEYTPFLSIAKKQLQLVESKQKIKKEDKKKIDLAEYEIYLNCILEKMKEIYQGDIIIAYHPLVSLQKSGEMLILEEETDKIFEKCCEMNEIKFINMSTAFIEAYEKEYVVPYGFMNTTMGTGHLNKYGHRIMADEIWKALNIKAGE